MRKFRIRAKSREATMPWIYAQEYQSQAQKDTRGFTVQSINKDGRTINKKPSQYSRFKYADNQYGKIDGTRSSSISLLKESIRIRAKEGKWIYSQYVEINGSCPAIRIRSKTKAGSGKWVYIQKKEV